MNFVADRINRINPSMTVGINIKAKAMKEEGKDVIVLAAGEPDFNTPKNIRDAANKAMDEGKQNMYLVRGLPNYKKQYKKNLKKIII